MNRFDFQRLAKIRIKEAEALLGDGYHNGAYYLAGYAIECALKACIAKQTLRYDFPEKRRVDNSHTHDLTKLVRVADLEKEVKAEGDANKAFGDNWLTVLNWSEETRYLWNSQEEALRLYNAIVDPDHGVLSWLRKFW